MNTDKLEKVKESLASFEALTNGVRELITEIEQNDISGELLEETIAELTSAESDMSQVDSALEDVESSVGNARSNLDDGLRSIRNILRRLEDKRDES